MKKHLKSSKLMQENDSMQNGMTLLMLVMVLYIVEFIKLTCDIPEKKNFLVLMIWTDTISGNGKLSAASTIVVVLCPSIS